MISRGSGITTEQANLFYPSEQTWMRCHECDALHEVIELGHGQRAQCGRCGSELYRHVEHSIDKVMVFSLSALMLFILANSFVFLSLKIGDHSQANLLVSATIELMRQGFPELSLLVFFTSLLFPLLVIVGLLYCVVSIRFIPLPAVSRVFRFTRKLFPWTLVGVFMLGVMVAVVKLMDLATVIPGPGLFFLAGLLLMLVASLASLDERLIWQHVDNQRQKTAACSGHQISCHSCRQLCDEYAAHCTRCGEPLHFRKAESISRTWALVITAAVLYIPANVYPIMTVTQLGRGNPDTILSGVVHLIEAQLWGLALLVFFASIMVPVLKLLVMSYLLISVQYASCWRPRDRTRLFRLTEAIGAWSMIDIFLIGILISLVKLDALATIEAGPGASFFAGVVVVTLLAAQSFDSRLIWDRCQQSDE